MSRAANPLGKRFDPLALLATSQRQRHQTTPEGFWEKVSRICPVGCWPWLGRLDKDGYGAVSWCGTDERAHRIAWALHNHTFIPAGVVIMHSCDFRPCCRPDHLSPGSRADNNADMLAKGRGISIPPPSTGVANVNAKLTDNLVREYRAAWRAGESIKSICRRSGLAVGTVHPMLHGKTWRHVAEAS